MLIGKTGLNTIANQVSQQGYSAAHQVSKETGEQTGVSNFGNETKAGASKFQQANERVSQDGEKATSAATKENIQTVKQFEEKQAYTKNATLAAIRQNTLDISK